MERSAVRAWQSTSPGPERYGQHCRHAWCRQPACPATPAFARPQGLKSLPVAVLAPASVAPLAQVEAPLVWSQHVATVRMCGLLNSLHISAGQATKAPSHHTSPHVANQCDGHNSRTQAAPSGMVPAEQGGGHQKFRADSGLLSRWPIPQKPNQRPPAWHGHDLARACNNRQSCHILPRSSSTRLGAHAAIAVTAPTGGAA